MSTQHQELELLLKVSEVLASAKPLQESLTDLLAEVLRTLSAERGFVVLRDGDGWTSFASHMIEVGTTLELGSYSRTLVEQVAASGETILVLDTTASSLYQVPSIVLTGIRSILCSPLKWDGQVQGAVYVDNRISGGLFKESHRQVLASIARQASQALHASWLQNRLLQVCGPATTGWGTPEDPAAVARTLDGLLHPDESSLPHNQNNPPVSQQAKVYLFGPLRLQGFRGTGQWKSRRDLEIFSYLALHQGRLQSEEKLMELFWPHKPPEKARHSLHNSITQIRKVLGDSSRSILVRQLDGYTLSKECRVDLTEFRAHCRSGLKEASREQWEHALGPLGQAEAAAASPLLEGLESEWVYPEREWVQGKLTEVRERFAAYFHARGKHLLALEGWNRILAHDPCHEAACRGQIRALVELGRAGEAKRAYEAFAQAFLRELDLPPPFALDEVLSEL